MDKFTTSAVRTVQKQTRQQLSVREQIKIQNTIIKPTTNCDTNSLLSI